MIIAGGAALIYLLSKKESGKVLTISDGQQPIISPEMPSTVSSVLDSITKPLSNAISQIQAAVTDQFNQPKIVSPVTVNANNQTPDQIIATSQPADGPPVLVQFAPDPVQQPVSVNVQRHIDYSLWNPYEFTRNELSGFGSSGVGSIKILY